MTDEQLTDYKQRLKDGSDKLFRSSYESFDAGDMQEAVRLQGKAAGLRLALDYLRAY